MQNRYVGDIGDYAKYSLLRALSDGFELGVSWYLYPDETNGDGGHIGYLLRPDKWREPDPGTFDTLRVILGDCLHENQDRGVAAIEESELLPGATFWNRLTVHKGRGGNAQARWRSDWFQDSMTCLRDCNIVFADPDNGLRERENFKPGLRKSGKSICEEEALSLADSDRPVIVYHHNTMFRGGHCAEVKYWQQRLGIRTCAVRWRPISPRTFFILNCTDELRQRGEQWCEKWNRPKQVYFQGYPVELDECG